MSRIELSKVASVSGHSEDVPHIAESQFASHAPFMSCHADVTCTELLLLHILIEVILLCVYALLLKLQHAVMLCIWGHIKSRLFLFNLWVTMYTISSPSVPLLSADFLTFYGVIIKAPRPDHNVAPGSLADYVPQRARDSSVTLSGRCFLESLLRQLPPSRRPPASCFVFRKILWRIEERRAGGIVGYEHGARGFKLVSLSSLLRQLLHAPAHVHLTRTKL